MWSTHTEMTFPTALSEQRWLRQCIKRRPHPRRGERSVAEQVGGGGSSPILDITSSSSHTHQDWLINCELNGLQCAIYRGSKHHHQGGRQKQAARLKPAMEIWKIPFVRIKGRSCIKAGWMIDLIKLPLCYWSKNQILLNPKKTKRQM